MKKAFFLLAIILFNNLSFAQPPKKYNFASPVDIPIILSGTFGELRSNHFHAGIDIKTQGREGLKVHAIDDGYISRINISAWGYGKAIYITHANGLTSVYGHLQQFNPKIQKYVKDYQYRNKKFSVTIYPKKNEFRVSKREIIALSGNTGGSGGPHLHFEIRDSKDQTPHNPFNYGYSVEDTRAPKVKGVFLYKLKGNTRSTKSLTELKLNYIKSEKAFNSNEIAIPAGYIGLGVNTYDKLNRAENKNGGYSVDLSENGNLLFEYKMNAVPFSEQRYINSLIDYGYYREKRSRIQKLFLEPGNKLSIYSKHVNQGKIKIEEGKKYKFKIVIKDHAGNKSIVNVNVKGTKAIAGKEVSKGIKFAYNQDNHFKNDEIEINVPKGALYSDFDFVYSKNKGIHNIGNPNVPLHKSYTLKIKTTPKAGTPTDKMVIVSVSKSGYQSSVGGKYSNGVITTTTRSFGSFTTALDTIAPKIKGLNIYDGKWMSKEKYIKISTTDNLAGLKSFEGHIDGKWILLDYEPKKNLLKFDFSDLVLEGKKHNFTLKVTDNVGNINKYDITFFR